MKFLRILPAICARMRCPLSSSTVNCVFGRASTMRPSVRIGSSLATRISYDDRHHPRSFYWDQSYREETPSRATGPTVAPWASLTEQEAANSFPSPEPFGREHAEVGLRTTAIGL